MLKYKNFILKKTTIIFEIVLIIISIVLSLFTSYKSSIFINYDNNYKDTNVEIYSNNNIISYIENYNNCRSIIVLDNNDYNYQYGYRVYLKHYYNYYDGLRDFIFDLREKGNDIKYKINAKGNNYQDIGDSVATTSTILKLLIFVAIVVGLLIIYNVISDEKRNNILLSYIGYSRFRILIINTFKIAMLLFIPCIVYILLYYLFIILLT